jgi:predicted dehydrogenase
MNNAADIRLAIVGCGAVTELLYLPALRDLRDARVTLLIDTDERRREDLASRFYVQHTRDHVDGCYDLFDAVIIALPNALHAPACIKLLGQRKAALIESPMAISVAECDAMINAAEDASVPLAVGLMQRFLWAHQLARFLLRTEALGRIEGFDFRDGCIYNWPVASDCSFRKEIAGGGVLMDTGAHTLDCLLNWLGDFSEVEYFDDAEGGVEANCLLNLRLQSGVRGVVELSRTRRLRNTAVIRCERGVIEVGLDKDHANYFKLIFSAI